jgi:hypothetical protein
VDVPVAAIEAAPAVLSDVDVAIAVAIEMQRIPSAGGRDLARHRIGNIAPGDIEVVAA